MVNSCVQALHSQVLQSWRFHNFEAGEPHGKGVKSGLEGVGLCCREAGQGILDMNYTEWFNKKDLRVKHTFGP